MVDDGLPGQAEEELAARTAEDQRLAGLNQDAIEKEFGPQSGEDALDDIVLARRDTAGKQQQIRLQTALDQLAGMFVTRRAPPAGSPERHPRGLT